MVKSPLLLCPSLFCRRELNIDVGILRIRLALFPLWWYNMKKTKRVGYEYKGNRCKMPKGRCRILD